jgi:hypothetical protein
MLPLLFDEHRRERPAAIIGLSGSFVALASFFLLPVGVAGSGGPLSPINGWQALRFFLSALPPGSILGLLIVLLLAFLRLYHAGHRGRGAVSACAAPRGPAVYAGHGAGAAAAGLLLFLVLCGDRVAVGLLGDECWLPWHPALGVLLSRKSALSRESPFLAWFLPTRKAVIAPGSASRRRCWPSGKAARSFLQNLSKEHQ